MSKSLKNRIDSVDALRGLAIVLMLVHHFLYDLVAFLDAPDWLYTNPVLDIFHYIFAGLFITLCGVSSRFSRSNLKRGLITLGVACGISLVTYIIDMPIRFGVLHLLAVCMLFFALTEKLINRIPRWIMLVFSVAGAAISAWCVNNIEIQSEHLWILGWTYNGFESFDYFPILPWIFVFLFGTWAGYYIKEQKFPRLFYTAKIPVLPAIGRHSLIIYIVHQPVLLGLTMLIKLIVK